MPGLGLAVQPAPMMPPESGPPTPEISAKLFELVRGGAVGPDGPQKNDPFADDKTLLKLFAEIKAECLDNRWVYERSWWRNLLYHMGRHWIYYDTGRGQWQDKRLAKWIPRPVTNKVAEIHQTILSLFESVDLVAKARPTGNRPEDISASEIADKMEPAIRAEHGMASVMRQADFWLIATGNVFLHPWWDKFAEDAPVLQTFTECPYCGDANPSSLMTEGATCERCDMPLQATDVEPSLISGGKGRTDICSPWEVAFRPGYTKFEEVPEVIRLRWRTKVWVEKHYPALARKMTFDKGTDERSLQLLRSLASQSDVGGNPSALLASSGVEQGEGVAEYEVWTKPSRDYPRGLFMRVLGDKAPQIIRDETQSLPGPLPYNTAQNSPIWPWIHIPYERIGGRVFGRSPLDAVCQKNDQLNQLDSLMQLIVQRSSNPIWLEPKGSEVKKFTGEPGLVVRYNPLIAAGNAKPERVEGSNIPHSLINLRTQILDDISASTGVHDVMKGSKPAGVEAFSAMQLLVERSQTRFGMVLGERGEGYRQWYAAALELERAYGPDERFFAVIGPNSTWQGAQFSKADLSGSVSIIVEDGSQAPKTNLGERAAIQQLQQLGILNPQDPDQSYAVLKTFGQQKLLPALDSDVKSALQEQDAFERWAISPASAPAPPPVPMPGTMGLPAMPPPAPISPMVRKPWHSDTIHLSEHRKWALADAARELFAAKPHVEQAFVAHMAEHERGAMGAAQGQPMFAPPMPMGPEPGAAAGAGQAMTNSNRESGNPADANKEIAQGTEHVARM